MPSIAERMEALFRGHTGGHGTYAQEERTPGKAKSEIKKSARTLRTGPTVELWEEHLAGTRPLGVIPVNTQGECIWGVIDVDAYDLNHADLAKRIDALGLPLMLCKSKSGGGHLFVFLKSPVSAADMMTKLREWAASLGYGSSEIFPKQAEILEDRGDLGNWLNMPYFDAERGQRHAISTDGRALSVGRFLTFAEKRAITPEKFLATNSAVASQDEDLVEGPPCLQYLAGIGVTEGGRNNALFAFGVFAKKKYTDSWEAKIQAWNQRFIRPSLTVEEVAIIVKGLRRKEYNYKCKDQPIASHCDARLCRTRKFGVGVEPAPEITSISYLDTEPALYFVCLTNGGTVECTVEEVLNARLFQKNVFEQLKMMIPVYGQNVWHKRVGECMDSAVVIEAPREVSSEGMLLDLLEEFCTDNYAAQDKDEIVLGKPWLDEPNGVYCFRLADFMAHLERKRFRELTRLQVSNKLKKLGAAYKFFRLKGKSANVYMMPEKTFSRQTEPHAIPRVEESPI